MYTCTVYAASVSQRVRGTGPPHTVIDLRSCFVAVLILTDALIGHEVRQ